MNMFASQVVVNLPEQQWLSGWTWMDTIVCVVESLASPTEMEVLLSMRVQTTTICVELAGYFRSSRACPDSSIQKKHA